MEKPSQSSFHQEAQSNSDIKMLNHKREQASCSEEKKSKYKKTNYNSNRKKSLCKLLEFYFSDDNLINDKFLTKILSTSQGVDINIILTFNKVKTLLNDIKETSKKKDLIIKACEISKKIYVNKNKISRRTKFDIKFINRDYIDDATLYVENLPGNTQHQDLYRIFNQWKVNYISIPKTKNECKGFAFVTFDKKEDVAKAITELNNTVPKEIINLRPKELLPLHMFTKREWAQKKKEFKLLKIELQKLNSSKFLSCQSGELNENTNSIPRGSLLKMTNVEPRVTVDDMRIFCNNLTSPIFIDIQRDGVVFLRFANAELANNFIVEFNKTERKYLNDSDKIITIEKLAGEEEEIYIKKVIAKKEEYQEKKERNKKNKEKQV